MTACKHGHAIRGPQDRLPNRGCAECNRIACRAYNRRTRSEAAKYRQIMALLAS